MSGNAGGGKDPHFRCAWKKERRGDWRCAWKHNTEPDASEKVFPKGEGRADLPILLALRQDIPGRHSGPCLRTGKVQSGRAGRRWTELLGNRDARVGGMAERH